MSGFGRTDRRVRKGPPYCEGDACVAPTRFLRPRRTTHQMTTPNVIAAATTVTPKSSSVE